MAILAVILFVLGAAAGGLGVWLMMARRLRADHAADARRAEIIIRLSHDIRGAVTPALLMAERLETNSDPAVKQAATIIATAMDRTTEIAKAASTEARATGVVAKGNPRRR
jgi:signal transduction histidine kinase